MIELTNMIYGEDANKMFNKMFRQLIDIHTVVLQKQSINKPSYERYLKSNFNLKQPELLKGLLEKMYTIRKDSGYYVDRNIFLYKILED